MARKIQILVVDDEKGVCDLFKKLLTKEGYDVSTALSGEACLKAMKKKEPDLVLLDLKMPGMDGIEVLRRIKKINNNIVVIIVTAYGGIKSAREAMMLGAYDYITKPFDIDHVKALVKDGLGLTSE